MRFINGANGYNGICIQNDNVHVTSIYNAGLKCCTEKSLPEQANTHTMYYTTDTHKIYIGMGSSLPLADMSDVLVFDSIYDFPNIGETNKIYIATKEKTAAVFNPLTQQYSTITSADASVLTYHSDKELPPQGDKNKLYLTDDNKIYRYDVTSKKYVIVSESSNTPLGTNMPSGDVIVKALGDLKNDEAAIKELKSALEKEQIAMKQVQADSASNKFAIQQIQADTKNYRLKAAPITEHDLDQALANKIVNIQATPDNSLYRYVPYLVRECIPVLTQDEVNLDINFQDIIQAQAQEQNPQAGGIIMFGMPSPSSKSDVNGMCQVTNHVITNAEGMRVYEYWKRSLQPFDAKIPFQKNQFLFMPELGVHVYINGIKYTENVDYYWYNLGAVSDYPDTNGEIHRVLRPAIDNGEGDSWLMPKASEVPTPNRLAKDPIENLLNYIYASHDSIIYPDGLGGIFTTGLAIYWGAPALESLIFPTAGSSKDLIPSAVSNSDESSSDYGSIKALPKLYTKDMLVGAKVEIEYYIGVMEKPLGDLNLDPEIEWNFVPIM